LILQRHSKFGISYGIGVFFVVILGLISFTESAYALTNISTCQILSVAGETYALTSDIGSSGDCIDITADGITLEGNGHKITGNGTGNAVDLTSVTGVTVHNLDISNFHSGIYFDGSSANTVTDNIFSNITYAVNFLFASTNNLISNNFFYNNVNGVHSWPSTSNDNTITLNTFYQSEHEQVQWHETNDNNLVYHNNFLNPQLHQIIDDCVGCTNQYSIASGGNYYSDYNETSEGCTDVNLDGFCDDPYIINNILDVPISQDDLPFTVQNGWDPSSSSDTAPIMVVPDDMMIGTGVASGAVVTFSPVAVDVEDGIITVTCTPPSGSIFPLGPTVVTCSVTDSDGNTVSETFSITVEISSTLTLTVQAIDNNGLTRNMYHEIILNGTVLSTGFTPDSHEITSGVEYTVAVGEFLPWVFDHWEDASTDQLRIITPTQDTTLTAFMIDTTMGDVIPPEVSASPPGGSFFNSVDVTLPVTDNFDPTPTIFYTTNGSTPTTLSPVYAGPITITADTTLNFLAVDSSGNVSPVSTEDYIITTSSNATLTINSVDMAGAPFPGFFTTISEGGTVVGTGFTPTTFVGTVGTTYTVETQDFIPYLFGNWEDGSTIAARDVTLSSDTTAMATYIDSTGDVTPPVVSASPTGGSYEGSVVVTLSATDDIDPTPTIYFTADGSTPTIASPLYFEPIPIVAATTLNFIAIDATGNASAVSTEIYRHVCCHSRCNTVCN